MTEDHILQTSKREYQINFPEKAIRVKTDFGDLWNSSRRYF